MSHLNQLFKAKLDKEFPPKQYPCSCKYLCTALGGQEGDCDNCSFCATAGEEQLDPEYWRNHYNYQEKARELLGEAINNEIF